MRIAAWFRRNPRFLVAPPLLVILTIISYYALKEQFLPSAYAFAVLSVFAAVFVAILHRTLRPD